MGRVHRIGDPRKCGAITESIGQNLKVFAENQLMAVMGDPSSHGMLGQLIPMVNQAKVFINHIPIIVSNGDRAAPDIVGLVMHPFSPTDPAGGAQKVFAFGANAPGGVAGILGSLVGGQFNIGELVSIGGQVVGTIQSVFNVNGGQATGTGFPQASSPGQSQMIVLQNLSGQIITPTGVLTGADTGATLTVESVNISADYYDPQYEPNYVAILENAIVDDSGVVAEDAHFTGYQSQDYNQTYIVSEE